MQLGFLVFEVADTGTWDHFLTEVLGLQSIGGGRFRMDGHDWRIQTIEGPSDDLASLGWELTEDEMDATLSRLQAAGWPFETADPGVRDVTRRVVLRDPSGIPVELVTGMAASNVPFESALLHSSFVADHLGLGHIVLSATDKDTSVRFWTELMGVRLSDHIVTEIYGHKVDLSFFHTNARHHSVALGGRLPKRLHHFMLEVTSMDDVGLCFDRVLRGGHRIAQTLGKHPNDQMFSFYAFSPSGFQFEFGWGGREVDDATWQPTTYAQISEWGHHPPNAFRPKKENR
jgi:2,3-dihydroxybiphenyl 1,2-dioxygenase